MYCVHTHSQRLVCATLALKGFLSAKKNCAQKNLEWESILTIHELYSEKGSASKKSAVPKIIEKYL